MGIFKKRDGRKRFGFGKKKSPQGIAVAHEALHEELPVASTPTSKAQPNTPPTEPNRYPEKFVSEVLGEGSTGSGDGPDLNTHQRSTTPVQQLLEEFEKTPNNDGFEVFADGGVMKRDPSLLSKNSYQNSTPVISRVEDEGTEVTAPSMQTKPPPVTRNGTRQTGKDTTPIITNASSASTTSQYPETVTRKLLSAFNNADACAAITELPTTLQEFVPDQLRCDIVPNNVEVSRNLERSESYYNDQFALDFLEVSATVKLDTIFTLGWYRWARLIC